MGLQPLKPPRRGVYRCILPDRLNPSKRRKWTPPGRLQPLSLAECCNNVLSAQPLPRAWFWTAVMVGRWVDRVLHLPQYKNCFLENHVNGRRLIRIEADTLPKMNITLFDHIQKITAGIRLLFGLELVLFARCITLPRRYPEPAYLLFRAPTGPARECATRLDLYRAMGMAVRAKAQVCALRPGRPWDLPPAAVVHVGLFNWTRLAGPHPSLECLREPLSVAQAESTTDAAAVA